MFSLRVKVLVMLPGAPVGHDEERRAPRYYFGDAVELTEFGSGQTIIALVRALSSYGCFIRTPKSFPIGTKVNLKFPTLGAGLSGVGRVVNHVANKANPGIGVEFVDVDPVKRAWFADRLAVLDTKEKPRSVGGKQGF
jgi:hypothetical protein